MKKERKKERKGKYTAANQKHPRNSEVSDIVENFTISFPSHCCPVVSSTSVGFRKHALLKQQGMMGTGYAQVKSQRDREKQTIGTEFQV